MGARNRLFQPLRPAQQVERQGDRAIAPFLFRGKRPGFQRREIGRRFRQQQMCQVQFRKRKVGGRLLRRHVEGGGRDDPVHDGAPLQQEVSLPQNHEVQGRERPLLLRPQMGWQEQHKRQGKAKYL